MGWVEVGKKKARQRHGFCVTPEERDYQPGDIGKWPEPTTEDAHAPAAPRRATS